jgi:hypothetical protein
MFSAVERFEKRITPRIAIPAKDIHNLCVVRVNDH